MALWPFRRKSGRKRSSSGAALSDAEGGPPRSQTGGDAPPPRAASQKKQRTDSQVPEKKLQRRARTYSFSPGRKDSIQVAGQDVTSAAPQAPGRPTRFSPGEQIEEESGQDHASSSPYRTPTLHNNARSDAHTSSSKRKSSKRRREDNERAAEIKAMSNNYTPLRPAAENWTTGRPMKKESKRAKTGLGRNSNPTSDISLPIPGSIHSTMSSESEHASYKVSAFDTLAPRPTLRRAFNPRSGSLNGSGPMRTSSQKRKLMEPGAIPEAMLKAHKRVDSLADELDAHDIRELMERDTRRRERKVQREQERVERRLARRAAKQREAEEEARKSGTPPPRNMERGVLGREAEEVLGADPTSTVRTSSKRRQPGGAPRKERKRSPDHVSDEAAPEALNHFHRTDSVPLDGMTEEPEGVKGPATPPPEDEPAKATFLNNHKAARSKTSLASEERRRLSTLAAKSEDSEYPRKDSESSARGKRTLASLFKWGSIRGNRRSGSGPSSFSNTSREEMQAAGQAQMSQRRSSEQVTDRSSTATPPAVAAFTPAKMSSGIPKRTRSRFREDLPELPVSPPDSRMASPDVEPPLPAVSEARHHEEGSAPIPIPMRNDTPASERRTIDETMRQTPTSMHRSTDQNSPQPQSVSLASIDSEASWLSGRIGKRSSSGMGMRDSVSRSNTRSQQGRSTDNDSDEDLADDEYLARLSPEDGFHGRRSTGEGRPSSDEGDHPMRDSVGSETGMKWGSVGARMPMVHGDGEMMRSREGLLNTVDEGGKSSSDEIETPHLEHAKSVDYARKGHVRHLSAGSAKLLDITPRASLEHRNNGPIDA
ncbi:hypothetical protein F5X68DRAFT_40851 [Plectosphaerella plurivora]|uniref:Uncharacterized protein n=1 Tax=Plectosphaerella plurivora TaxID=936078 RepID=A0A9P9A7Y1_9PEZI|nr:hypothetical protein F5X68DRAFT_40851 [Plectosphaerella plurivora]